MLIAGNTCIWPLLDEMFNPVSLLDC